MHCYTSGEWSATLRFRRAGTLLMNVSSECDVGMSKGPLAVRHEVPAQVLHRASLQRRWRARHLSVGYGTFLICEACVASLPSEWRPPLPPMTWEWFATISEASQPVFDACSACFCIFIFYNFFPTHMLPLYIFISTLALRGSPNTETLNCSVSKQNKILRSNNKPFNMPLPTI